MTDPALPGPGNSGSPGETLPHYLPPQASESLPIFNDSCPNLVSNIRLKIIHPFEGHRCLAPHRVASVRSVPCGMIFPRPSGGCGALASAAKAPIALICTICGDLVRSGTPSTAAWPRKRMQPGGRARGSIALTRIGTKGRFLTVEDGRPSHPACFRCTVMRRLENRLGGWG
jgi:hypothetical protein